MASAPLGRLLRYLKIYFGRIPFVAPQQFLCGRSDLLGVHRCEKGTVTFSRPLVEDFGRKQLTLAVILRVRFETWGHPTLSWGFTLQTL